MNAFGRSALAGLAAATVALSTGRPAAATVVTIPPSHDNSLFGDNVDRSCGSGPLFVGKTFSFGIRRGVIAFDVAGSVPPGSTVTSVELRMNVELSGPGAVAADVHSVHRLLADWGEFDSVCTDGLGAPAELGDATWTDRHFPTDAWSAAGGDFAATASGAVALPTLGAATMPSQAGMVADVQSWLDAPSGNFGWILVGNEAVSGNARKLSSRESAVPPSLRIEFISPPPPAVPDGTVGSPVLVSKVATDGVDLRVSWDGALCAGSAGDHIVFGASSGWPAVPSDPYILAGGVCDIGVSPPFVWTGSPDPALVDPVKKLIWMLVVADDGGTTEGSWGRSSAQERNGPGPNGCSDQCGVLDKSVVNTCGNGR